MILCLLVKLSLFFFFFLREQIWNCKNVEKLLISEEKRNLKPPPPQIQTLI